MGMMNIDTFIGFEFLIEWWFYEPNKFNGLNYSTLPLTLDWWWHVGLKLNLNLLDLFWMSFWCVLCRKIMKSLQICKWAPMLSLVVQLDAVVFDNVFRVMSPILTSVLGHCLKSNISKTHISNTYLTTRFAFFLCSVHISHISIYQSTNHISIYFVFLEAFLLLFFLGVYSYYHALFAWYMEQPTSLRKYKNHASSIILF